MMDVRKGTPGNDDIVGTPGNHNINAGNGDDTVRGGAGDDTVRGGNDNDLVRGGSGNDDVRGGFGEDTVRGGEGDDTLNGGRDSDVLVGGRGADIFVFDGVWGEDAGEDVVIDFEDGIDSLQLLNIDAVAISDTADGAFIELSTGGSITLLGVDADQVDADDFVGQVPEFTDPGLL